MTSSYPLNPDYKNRTSEVFTTAIRQYPRLAVFRADLRFPADKAGRNDKRVISRFFDNLKYQMASLFNAKRQAGVTCDHPTSLHYIWCREYGAQNGNRHYHVVLLLNKDAFHRLGGFQPHKEERFASLANLIQKAWCSALSLSWPQYCSLASFPENPVIWIERNSVGYEHQYAEALNRALYLCKETTKRYGDGRSFGCSQAEPSVIGSSRKRS